MPPCPPAQSVIVDSQFHQQKGPPQQQPYQMQAQQQQLDPWAAMLTPTPAPAPAPAPHAPPPSHEQAPPAAPTPQQRTPPPAMVVYDASYQNPPSPMGDVSVLAAAFRNSAAPAQPLMPQPRPAAIAPVNPFDFDAVASSMPPPPSGMPPPPPPTPPRDANQQPQQQQQQQQQQATAFVAHAADPFGYARATSPTPQPFAGPPTSPVPQAAAFGAPPQQQYAPTAFSPQQAHDDPFGYAFSPVTSPVVGAGVSRGNNDCRAMIADVPFAPPPYMPGTSDCRAVVPSLAVNDDPFGVFGSAHASDDPFGAGVLGGSSSALVATTTSSTTYDDLGDPFGGMFGAPAPAAAPTTASAGDGFAASLSSSRPLIDPRLEHLPAEKPIELDSNGLPSKGEYYEARINAKSLGAMFYTARNLEETLFLTVPNNVIEALGQRPVVAYVAENSAAHNAGVNLGHVILSVNGHEVTDPEYCAAMIRNSPRPTVLRCFAPPDLELTVSEGLHKVYYHSKDINKPCPPEDWKEKFVVVGGIVTKPWMMNMFYKRADYDIAVKEAHAGQTISVKVKQFDLRGARVLVKGMDGMPDRVVYPSEGRPWHYITIIPNKGYPIKISSKSRTDLEPIYSAVRRFVKKDMEARYSSRMNVALGRSGGM
ncbi:hypothetical protein ACHAW5_011341 [Stephanodiscus triporus]|uniref:PDZ domain-containing protein n=1 Tax=Stephanodiscus triporus TaxID=2934178 RepID=A0ABD3QU97_9STRA